MSQPELKTDSQVSAASLIRARDWSTSPLGHPAAWPGELRAIVQVIRESRFPMFVAWGPELGFLYNEPYAQILGKKHPSAFGSRFQDIWGEIWTDISPLINRALGGEAIYTQDMPLFIQRDGRQEQAWFTFSYSPVRDHTGKVAGLYCAVAETTDQVIASRRQAFQLEVADTLRALSNPLEIMAAASRLLGQQVSAGRVGYGEVDEERGIISVDRDWTANAIASLAGVSRPLNSFGPTVVNVATRGTTVRIDDISADERSTSYAESYASVGVGSMIVVPLLEAQRLTAILFVHEPVPRRWTDSEVGLAEEVARRTWEALKRARAEEALRDETRVLELLNKTAATAASTLDVRTLLQSITDAATEFSGAQFGAFFYNAKSAEGDALTLYTLSGAPREAFEGLGHPRATPVFGPTFNGGPPVRSDDITKDARYGKWGPHHGMPAGHLPVRSYLAVSVTSRSGEPIGGLFFGHPDIGVFTERTERIIAGIATQAAMAVDNARLYEAAQQATQDREVLLSRERDARMEAERLNRMKDEFLAMLAHELRNPLAPISSAAELLGVLFTAEPKVLQTSAIISRQVSHMTRLVDDLLDVSRVTRGLVNLHKAPIDFRQVISSAVDQAQPLITEKRHHLDVDIPAEAAYVHGDHTRLVQAVSNILNNAAKYTPEAGDIKLKVSIVNHHLQVSIADNGSGMAPELVPEVFELFSQGARTLARSQGGLGLGLALVKKLVELHDGTVNAHSDGVGKGSEFVIELPLLPFELVGGMHDSALVHAPAQHRSVASNPMLIMVIDDNVDAANMLAARLRAEGYRVAAGYSAQEALTQASQEAPAMFLLDIGLPDMDGYELATQLQAIPRTKDSVLIAVTGYGQAQDQERAKAAGFAHHLVKPVDMTHLFALLDSAAVGPSPTR